MTNKKKEIIDCIRCDSKINYKGLCKTCFTELGLLRERDNNKTKIEL